MAPSKSSIVWKFYKKTSGAVALCTICDKEIRYHGSTGNLKDHLRRKHPLHLSFQYPVTGSLDVISSTVQPTNSGLETDGLSVSTSNANVPMLVVLSATTETGIECDSGFSMNYANTAPVTDQNNSGLLQVPQARRKKNRLTSMKSVTATVKQKCLSNHKINETDSLLVDTASDGAGSKRSEQTSEKSIAGIAGKQKKQSANRSKEIDNLLVDVVCEGYLPFTLVENKKFIKLLNILEPCYKLPSRKTLGNELVNERYLKIREVIYSRLVKCQYIALAVDMWTSIHSEQFLSVTAHFVQDGMLHAAMLCSRQIDESLVSESIYLHIKSIIDEWNISAKVFALVTENTTVMADVANKLCIKHIECAAHSLNLVVSDVFNHPELEDFSLLRQKCRKIVGVFKSSPMKSSKLVECQKQLQKDTLKLKQETLTCWSTTFIMLERLIQVKEALIMAFCYVNCNESLTAADWEIIEDCIPVLEPLHDFTEELSCEKYSTASIVIPLVQGCQKVIYAVKPGTCIGTKLRLHLLDALSKRMTLYETNCDISAKATILDPRFKKCGFGVAGNATITVNKLVSELDNEQSPNEDNMGFSSGVMNESQSTDPTDKKKKKKIWKYFFEQKDGIDTTAETSFSVKDDMQLYLSNPLVDMEELKTDPISHWKKYEESMKILADAAYKYLCIPATSIPSERLFSKAGQILTERRNRLKAKAADKLVFLNANMKFGS